MWWCIQPEFVLRGAGVLGATQPRPVDAALYSGWRSPLKIINIGNAGSGKSTLSGRLIARNPAPRLSLNEVAFHGGTERRRLQDSIGDVKRFVAENESRIIEGCYSDIMEPILTVCEELIFLNPGVDVCVAHCRVRPCEPEKFGYKEEQDENLGNLI